MGDEWGRLLRVYLSGRGVFGAAALLHIRIKRDGALNHRAAYTLLLGRSIAAWNNDNQADGVVFLPFCVPYSAYSG